MTLKREYAEPMVGVACAALPAIGTYWAIDNQLIAITVSALQAALVLLGFRFVSRITVPEAFALGYFSSFLEPSVHALGHGGRIRYRTPDARPIEQELRLVNARLQVVLPEDLDIEEGPPTPLGLSEVLRLVQANCISGELVVSDTQKPFGVYLDLADPQRPLVVDVPNNLRALREFVLRETDDARPPSRKSRGTKVLSEYVRMLEKSLLRHRDRLQGRVEILHADALGGATGARK